LEGNALLQLGSVSADVAAPKSDHGLVAGPARPSITFETITFSDGQTLRFDDDEIIVFVGPNNAGKSAALRELQNFIKTSSVPQNVVTAATLRKVGNAASLGAYLEKNAQKSGDLGNVSYGGMGFQIHHTHFQFFDRPDRHPVAPFFSVLIGTEDRLTSSNPASAIALHRDPPSHPIHVLLTDEKLAGEISGFFRRAFNKDLVVFRAGGGSFPLYVGEKPDKLSEEDELAKRYVEALLSQAKPLQTQGDGMRSFATVLLYVLAADSHSVQFLDEPEAFLHPPQARLLGEYIAQERRSKSQLFIATHSTDILDGLMAGGLNKIRLIRIRRDGDVNHIKELSREKTASISNDPLTRYSGVFSGIFFQRVIIAEADSDCLFYNSILRTRAVTGDQHPDVLFIHAAGKHRMGELAETLKALGVPVSIVADLDLLNDEGTFKGLVQKLGGSWDGIGPHWRAIKTSVEGLRPPMTADQVKSLIAKELEAVGGVEPFPKQSERQIKYIFKTLSPWEFVKQAGRSGFSGGQTTSHFDQLSDKCAKLGLWLVPVGELEGFCRSVDARHGPAFVEKVLRERDLELDQELQEARDFVKKIWEAPSPEAARNNKPAEV
jgi:energy-coupling factor transporter ATP-binding protein EcfA2